MELDKRNVKKILLIITFAVGLYTIVQNLGVVFGAVVSIWSVLSTVITGFGIAFVLNILLRILEKGVFRFMNESTKPLVRRLRRPLCLLLTILLALGFMIVIGLVIIPQVLNTFLNLLNKFPGYINTAVLWIEEKFNSLNFLSLGLPSLSIDWEKNIYLSVRRDHERKQQSDQRRHDLDRLHRKFGDQCDLQPDHRRLCSGAKGKHQPFHPANDAGIPAG